MIPVTASEPAVPAFAPLTSALSPNERAALPGAIIVDLDGTLCLHVARGPFEWNKVLSDAVNSPVLSAVRAYHRYGARILFTSGRPDHTRDDTQLWLERNASGVPYQLFMRASDDFRNDAVVKYDIYRDHIHDQFHVIMVFDDRNRVVDMWRGIGLCCAQVAPGDF